MKAKFNGREIDVIEVSGPEEQFQCARRRHYKHLLEAMSRK